MTTGIMTKRELLDLLAELGIHPRRRLGQNFLIDANMLAAMVRLAGPRRGERILEIGPGAGVLTRLLLEAGCRVTAVEVDPRLAAYLRREFAGVGGFELVEADACSLDYDSLIPAEPYRCLANLPYRISSVLLATFARLANPPRELFILLQRETAERLTAASGTREYGALTVRVRLAYDVEVLRRLPSAVFYPAPEVESAYVRLALRPDRPPPATLGRIDRLLRLAFAQRRKRLAKLVAAGGFGSEAVLTALASLGVSVDARAEDVSPGGYLALANILDGSPHP